MYFQKNNIDVSEWVRIDAGHTITDKDLDDYLDRIQYRGRSESSRHSLVIPFPVDIMSCFAHVNT